MDAGHANNHLHESFRESLIQLMFRGFPFQVLSLPTHLFIFPEGLHHFMLGVITQYLKSKPLFQGYESNKPTSLTLHYFIRLKASNLGLLMRNTVRVVLRDFKSRSYLFWNIYQSPFLPTVVGLQSREGSCIRVD